MIRHYDPGAQFVTLTVKEAESVFGQRRDVRSAQMTFAPALVEIGFELLASFAVVLDFPECGPLGAEGGREGIGQAKSDELGQTRLVAMWQVTALVPAAKA